jgi:hypothetical protein
MTAISTAHQAPSAMEQNEASKSALQSNKTVDEAITEVMQSDIQKGKDSFQQNVAVATAEITGKGSIINIAG